MAGPLELLPLAATSISIDRTILIYLANNIKMQKRNLALDNLLAKPYRAIWSESIARITFLTEALLARCLALFCSFR